MKFKSKLIAFIILVSLAFVFGYQLYWLRRSYDEQYEKLENSIKSAMNNADFKEITYRIFTLQQLPDTSTVKQLIINPDELATFDTLFQKDGRTIKKGMLPETLRDSIYRELDTTSGPNMRMEILINSDKDSNKLWSSTTQMNFSIQSGLHEAIDSVYAKDFNRFYDLLKSELQQLDIDIPFYVEYVDTLTNVVKMRLPEGIQVPDTDGYQSYDHVLKVDKSNIYRIKVKEPQWYIFKGMGGLIAISFAMIALLVISYVYLLRIIWRQKSIDEIKGDFINNMTHELKTPISVTYAAVDALQNFGLGDDPEKRKQYLDISREQLMYLNSLVEQILTMSVEERKNLRLVPEVLPVGELFLRLKKQFLLNAGKEISFEISVVPEELTVEADRIHFVNILSNLIENAIKYSGDRVQIGLKGEKKGGQTVLSVTDNGIGIPHYALDKIFDKFYRVSTGNIHNVKGYGLGLSYVKTIVEKQGWQIKVESNVGAGSCFKIIIP